MLLYRLCSVKIVIKDEHGMAPNVRIGSLFGTKRFGAFDPLHLVLVAILHD